eukprot:TRINITY_DN2323_c0_g1_i1.p1 TRINITY_DN2323_c0_g1~~TRINITY_DN2323_c0_g1_i1.p1  ORF type:complete len:863 (+),score=126.52 TRINITY_DN2323_c0_g1_i1:141-2729(+)
MSNSSSNENKEGARKISEVNEDNESEGSNSKRLKTADEKEGEGVICELNNNAPIEGSSTSGFFSECISQLSNGDQEQLAEKLKSHIGGDWGFPDLNSIQQITPALNCTDEKKRNNAYTLFRYFCEAYIKHSGITEKQTGYRNLSTALFLMRRQYEIGDAKEVIPFDQIIEDIKTNDEVLLNIILDFWKESSFGDGGWFNIKNANKFFVALWTRFQEYHLSSPKEGLAMKKRFLCALYTLDCAALLTEDNLREFLSFIATLIEEEREDQPRLVLHCLKCVKYLCCKCDNDSGIEIPYRLVAELGFQKIYQSFYGPIKDRLHYKIMVNAFYSEMKIKKRKFFEITPEHQATLMALAEDLLNRNLEFRGQGYFAQVFKPALLLDFPKAHLRYFVELLERQPPQESAECLQRLHRFMETHGLMMDDFLQVGGENLLNNYLVTNENKSDFAALSFLKQRFESDSVFPSFVVLTIMPLLRSRHVADSVLELLLLYLVDEETFEIYMRFEIIFFLVNLVTTFVQSPPSDERGSRTLQLALDMFIKLHHFIQNQVPVSHSVNYSLFNTTIVKALEVILENEDEPLFNKILDFLLAIMPDELLLNHLIKKRVLKVLIMVHDSIPQFQARIQTYFERLAKDKYKLLQDWKGSKILPNIFIVLKNPVLLPLMCKIIQRFSKDVLTFEVQSPSEDDNKGANVYKTMFKKAYASQRFVDVNFVFDDGAVLKAHKVILMGFSSVFDAMFNAGFSESNEHVTNIKLPQHDSKIFDVLLKCTYGCDVDLTILPTKDIFDLVALADRYNISEVITISDKSLARMVGDTVDDLESVLTLLDFALKFKMCGDAFIQFAQSQHLISLLQHQFCSTMINFEKQ